MIINGIEININRQRFLVEAMNDLCPLLKWVCRDGQLLWEDDPNLRPSDDVIEEKIEELISKEPIKLLRVHRDRLIAETDWWVLPDRTPSSEQLAYRQELRDLPETATPVLDPTNPLGISGVDWPVKPS
jgi:Phage tail assembly chaperone protein